jgi:hypothetical protein
MARSLTAIPVPAAAGTLPGALERGAGAVEFSKKQLISMRPRRFALFFSACRLNST